MAPFNKEANSLLDLLSATVALTAAGLAGLAHRI
jgi:hypothetical protein